jgi:hypothetical protein
LFSKSLFLFYSLISKATITLTDFAQCFFHKNDETQGLVYRKTFMPLPDTAERLEAKNLPSRTHARTRYINIINYFLVAEKRAGREGRQGGEDRQREGGEREGDTSRA